MENGCQSKMINCCFCNCMKSISVTISEIIFSLLGIIINSMSASFYNRINQDLSYLFTLNYINISYFSSSSVISVIILILKKLEMIERSFGYKFGNYSTLLYSYLSKIISVLNIIGFLYILGFSSIVTISFNIKEAKEVMPVTYIGSYGTVDLIHGTKGVEMDCSNMECSDEEKKQDNLIYIDYIEFLIFCLSTILSSIFTFFNGASFSSEKQRIGHLIKGKIDVELIPIETKDLFGEKFCQLLNSITCYRMTVLRILNLITLISFISFATSLITVIIGLKNSWPQAIFFTKNIAGNIGLILPILTLLSGIYCRDAKYCGFDTPPTKRKCIMIILLLLVIIFFPFQLLGFTILFTSQIGASRISVTCTNDESCDDAFSIYDNKYREKYTLIFNVKEATIGKMILGFILGIIPPFCFFFLIVLMVTYIVRALTEYNLPYRAYEAKLFIIEDNGNKTDLNNFEIISKRTNIKKLVNNREVEEEIITYHRNLKSNNVINI